ncbi:hypothetical protein ACWD4G_07530 [Streptomyces sp. NPDC002643]
MTSRPTTMDPPPLLGLPPEEPKPPADCEPCAARVRERSEARSEGDWSQVSDMNVLIRRHHPPRRKRRR